MITIAGAARAAYLFPPFREHSMNTHPFHNSAISRIVRCSALCLGLLCFSAPVFAQSRTAGPAVAHPDDVYWDARFGIPGIDQAGVHALMVQGSDVYAGGDFTSAGGVRVNGVARWDGTAWHALGTGVEGVVTAIVASGADLFVAGTFFRAGAVPARGIARWDGTAWHALTDNGVTANIQGTISSLAVIGDNLYVGGSYSITTAAGTLQHIARWNRTTGTWGGLDGGLENRLGTTRVNTLAVRGRVLYVGGLLSHVGTQGIVANNVAAWDDSLSLWSTLGSGAGNGVNGEVTLCNVFDDDVVVGGKFSATGLSFAGGIARWNMVSRSWSAFGPIQFSGLAAAVKTDSGLLVAFNTKDPWPGGREHARLRRWDGAYWSDRGAVNGAARDMLLLDATVLMGGEFTSVEGQDLRYLVRWDGNAWSGFAQPIGGGYFAEVNAVAVDGDDVYVGGTFSTVQGRVMNNITRWNRTTNTWTTLGPDSANGVDGDVYAIRVMGDHVYVGGFFGHAGDVRSENFARLKKSENRWESGIPLPGRPTTNGAVYALAADPTNPQYLYIGGAFTIAGGDTVMGMTRWDDVAQRWAPMAGGLENLYASITVDAMDFDGSTLYVAGAFEPLHGSMKTVFARYAANAWYLVADNIDGSIRAITHVSPTSVVIGGEFTVFGSAQNISNLVSWNPVLGNFDWLDGGTDGPVHAVAAEGSSVFIGGDFTTVGGKPAASIARRTAGIWRSFGSGTDGPVNALAASGGDVFAGGRFLQAGEKSAFHFSRWDNRVLPVEDLRAAPDAPSLAITPMPVRDEAVLTFRLPTSTDVTIRIYDGLGRLVSTLLDGQRDAGLSALRWTASALPRGVYYARMSAGTQTVVSPLVLLGIGR
jgi:trimeric autotransporter adhesin